MDQIKHANEIDYIVIFIYLFMLSGAGIYLYRFNRSSDDYFKGGGRIPWWMAGLSTFVSGFSAFMFVGAAGYAYKKGLSALILFTSAFWGYWLGYFIYAVKWRRARLSSPMEFLSKRYSQTTTYYYTLLSIIPSILGLGMGIYTLCIFISTALGIINWYVNFLTFELNGLEITILLVGLVMLIYTTAGGLWAVVITDVMQFIIILVVTMTLLPISLNALGNGINPIDGIKYLLMKAPDGYFNLNDISQRPLFYLAYLINVLIGYNAVWFIGQRYYSVRTESDSRRMALLCSILSLVLPLFWITPAMVSRILFPSIEDIWPQLSEPAEASLITLALYLLPNGIIGITISAVLAATMSTIDTNLNYIASIIVKDIYMKIRSSLGYRRIPERRQLKLSRYTILVLGIFAIISSLMIQKAKGVFEFTLTYYSWFMPSMFVPVMLGFVYTKTPSWSAIASATTGLVLVSICNLIFELSNYQYEVNTLVGTFSSSIIFFASSLWKERNLELKRQIESFALELKTPVTSDVEKLPDPNVIYSYKIVGMLSAIIGSVIIALSIISSDNKAGLLNLAIGTFLLISGSIGIWYLNKKLKFWNSIKSECKAKMEKSEK